MLLTEIFYSTFWVSMISIIWFYTDWFVHYGQLLGFAINLRLEYLSYVIENPDSYFPDFLYEKSLASDDHIIKFLAKVVSCPFCLITWLSVGASFVYGDFIMTAPVYILSLFIVLQIKRMI